jgi:DNA repair photolyase
MKNNGCVNLPAIQIHVVQKKEGLKRNLKRCEKSSESEKNEGKPCKYSLNSDIIKEKGGNEQMSIIYEPKGRAKEYCELAANLYRGCGHGCKYCYAPEATRTDREKFYREPQPRKDVISKLSKQLEKNTFNGPVLLCFTCDPYQPINDEYGLARSSTAGFKAKWAFGGNPNQRR